MEEDFYPHCDQDVLHAPGSCKFCDMFPKLQEKRKNRNINFTGENDLSKRPCPAQLRRSEENINKWPGNRVEGYGSQDAK